MEEAVSLLSRGGAVMWVIAVASVIALAFSLERLVALRRSRVCPKTLYERVSGLVETGRVNDATLLASESRTAAGALYRGILRNAGQPLYALKEVAEEIGRHEAARLERGLPVLGVIASISPLLGLLGTVTGMIRVFQVVAETGVGSPLEMAAGIWESLLTTAFGLIVGIPAVIAHRLLQSRADSLVLELEETSLRLAEAVDRNTPHAAGTPAVSEAS